MTEPTADRSPLPFVDALGPRAHRRAEPRASIAVAGAGCALAVLGVLIVSGDRGASGDGFNQWPGALLSAAVVIAGFFTLTQVRQGSIATGGAVAALLGVPSLMFFLTFDEGGLPPYSTEGILLLTTAAWLASYLWSPGKGRPVFLAAGLIGVWATILQLTEELFDAPYGLFGFFGFDTSSSFEGDSSEFGQGFESVQQFHTPDWTTIGVLSLLLGIGYLVVTRVLDGRGCHGAATPFAFATIPPLVVGVVALANDAETAGTGLLTMTLGAAVSWHGAGVWRRGTTWIGGAAVSLGAAIFLGDMTDDATVGGMLFLAAGVAIVFASHAYASAVSEPDEMAPTQPVLVPAVVADDEVEPTATNLDDAEPSADDTEWAPPDE